MMTTYRKLALYQLIFCVSIGVFPSLSSAAPRVSFRLSYNKAVNSLSLEFSPGSSDGDCNYLLYASSSKSKLKGSFRGTSLVGQFEGGPEAYDVRADAVPYFFRKSRRTSSTQTMYFRAVFACSSGVGMSDRVSAKFTRLIGQGFASEGQWSSALRQQFRTTKYSLRRVFPNLTFTKPTDFQSIGDNRVFVGELGGKIWTFLNDQFVQSAKLYLDISSLIRTEGEQGLLGFAFHPSYFQNGYIFVHYSAKGTGDTTIARFQVSPSDPNQIDFNTGQIILQFPATVFQNHKGGQIGFGPDGYLYIALGDGGSSGDPLNSGQNLGTLLGKILRIDVNNTENGLQYAIPATNPFKGVSGAREEIYAYGFRNPWRFSFDVPSLQLWVADVGQDSFEEVDIVAAGGNYGWNTMEGFACYPPGAACNTSGLSLPYFNYSHNGAEASITGGFVYRGHRSPELAGKYIYADFINGRIWALSADGGGAINTELINTDKFLVTFGRDSYGEIFVLSYNDGGVYMISSPGSLAQ